MAQLVVLEREREMEPSTLHDGAQNKQRGKGEETREHDSDRETQQEQAYVSVNVLSQMPYQWDRYAAGKRGICGGGSDETGPLRLFRSRPVIQFPH